MLLICITEGMGLTALEIMGNKKIARDKSSRRERDLIGLKRVQMI